MRRRFTRRAFLKTACAPGAALTVGPALSDGQTQNPVTLAFVGCAEIHTPGSIKLLNGRKDASVKGPFTEPPESLIRRSTCLSTPWAKGGISPWGWGAGERHGSDVPRIPLTEAGQSRLTEVI
ncbi:MAG: twin-arginine translocation signal domain-containing protein [Acidobacteria bacterium]|nr:twin-arginine translocation signal domain-containing protein [Acidobacteriota bacterium]